MTADLIAVPRPLEVCDAGRQSLQVIYRSREEANDAKARLLAPPGQGDAVQAQLEAAAQAQLCAENELSRRMASAAMEAGQLRGRLAQLEREVEYLRHYGNKDCTAMADKAMADGTMDDTPPELSAQDIAQAIVTRPGESLIEAVEKARALPAYRVIKPVSWLYGQTLGIGSIVYPLLRSDYGTSRDDTRLLGQECIAVTKDPGGDYPFCTVPRSSLVSVTSLKPCDCPPTSCAGKGIHECRWQQMRAAGWVRRDELQQPVAYYYADKVAFLSAMAAGKGCDVWPSPGEPKPGRELLRLCAAPGELP